MAPTRKVSAATIAAAATTVLFVVLRDAAGYVASPELQGAATTLLVGLLAWVVPEGQRAQNSAN